MVELVDTMVLEAIAKSVGVRVSLWAPIRKVNVTQVWSKSRRAYTSDLVESQNS